MKRIVLYFILIAIIAIQPGCGNKKDDGKKTSTVSDTIQRHINPALAIYDLNGQEYSFSKFSGSVLLVNIWASWVTSVPAEFEKLKKLQAENKEKNFKIISIALDDQYSEGFKKFYNTSDINFDVYVSLNNSELLKNFTEYKDKIPCYYLVDKNMTIRKYSKNGLNVEEILKEVKELLDEK